MLTAIAKIMLRARVRRENSGRQKKFLPWDKIEKLALIVEKQEALNKSRIDKFIDDTKKYVEVFYIEPDSRQPSFTDWHCFSKKDVSLWKLPKKAWESELHSKTFDAVINTCSEKNLFAFAICAALPAYLKCGENTGFNLADLIIRKAEPFHLSNYLEDTVKYLKMIRN